MLYLVVCAAPPALAVGELVGLLQDQNWVVCVIASPRAAGWIDLDALAHQTGYPVRSDYKHPDDPDVLPLADGIVVAPATFNTIKKWVAGVSDNFALGILNEAIGLKLPITVAPYAKWSLAAHPAFPESLRTLSRWGVAVLENEVLKSKPAQPSHGATDEDKHTFNWLPVVEAVALGVGRPADTTQ